MSSFFYSLAFHRSGKPRKWLVFALFSDGMTVRPMFRRIVHKRNGRVRPRFSYFMTKGANPVLPQRLRPEELALRAMLPFEATVQSWRGKSAPSSLLSRDELMSLLAPDSPIASLRLLISVSQDDYTRVPGGVQLCIQREQKLAVEQGFNYLQIHPWYPLPRLAHIEEGPDTIINLILDGKLIGSCPTSTLIGVALQIAATSGVISIVVHQLLGHLPEQIVDLVQATGSGRCVFWLHDFFSICPSYTLQRNNLVFCSGPPITSNACGLCVYGLERTTHLKRIKAFFDNVRVDVASPSTVTAEFWQAKAGLKTASISVLPHMSLDVVARKSTLPHLVDGPITVGYLGAPAQHKGWPVFANLMQENFGSGNYRFVVMSVKRPRLGEDDWVSVHVTADNLTAMSDAVAAEDIDIVLHWPTWPETFSFTTFEALAGSAYVVTNSGSGNVAAVVKQTGRGAILDDEDELLEFFRSGQAWDLATSRREAKRDFEVGHRHSDMSLSLIMKG